MNRSTIDEIVARRLSDMNEAERAEYDEAQEAAELAFKIGDAVRGLREAAGLSQRAHGACMVDEEVDALQPPRP